MLMLEGKINEKNKNREKQIVKLEGYRARQCTRHKKKSKIRTPIMAAVW